jgi:adenine-specific DNA-methyltransferase
VIIELDGGQHASKKDTDASRTEFLEAQGYRVLRFWDNDVIGDVDAVLQRILLTIGLGDGPSPYPLPSGKRVENARHE